MANAPPKPIPPFRFQGNKIKIHPDVTYIPVWFTAKHSIQWKTLVRGTVIDCGTGTRDFEQLFAGQYDKYLGFDFESDESRWEISLENIDFNASIDSIPIGDNSADTVLNYSVLEHVPFDPLLGLKEMYRILKPGGFAFISIPFTYNTHGKNSDFWRWTQYGFEKHLTQCGFQVCEILEFGGAIIRLVEMVFKFYWTVLNAMSKVLPFNLAQNSLHNWLIQLPQRVIMALYYPFFKWLYGYGGNFDNKCKKTKLRRSAREGMHPFTMAFIAIAKKPGEIER